MLSHSFQDISVTLFLQMIFCCSVLNLQQATPDAPSRLRLAFFFLPVIIPSLHYSPRSLPVRSIINSIIHKHCSHERRCRQGASTWSHNSTRAINHPHLCGLLHFSQSHHYHPLQSPPFPTWQTHRGQMETADLKVMHGADVWKGWFKCLSCACHVSFPCLSISYWSVLFPQQKSTAKPHLPLRLQTRMSWLWKRATLSASWTRYSFTRTLKLWNKETGCGHLAIWVYRVRRSVKYNLHPLQCKSE